MSRAARTLGALVVMVCCLAAAAVAPGYAGPGGARPEARLPVAPVRLPVSIEGLTPSTLTPGEPVQVSGTVYNNTDGVWGDAQVGMLASPEPFTSASDVAAATRADPYEDFVGEQVLAPGTFDDIGDIAPGQTRSFTFTVPYAQMELSGTEGVYHVGAELRVTDADGLRGSVARTLTFMPLVQDPAQAPAVDLAMLWPMTAPVPWNGSAFLNRSLSAQFAPTGRLRTLAELGATAGTAPLTWVLDPAVLDAARTMSDGFRQADARIGPRDRQAVDASEWLELVTDAVGRELALSVPYGHPDVAALAHADIRPGLAKAERAGVKVLDELRIAHLGLLWPGNGLADRDILRSSAQLDPELALLSQPTFADQPTEASVGLRTPANGSGDGRTTEAGTRSWDALVLDRNRSRHGLRAQPGWTTLQWRQLILSNTALRSLYRPARRAAVAMPSHLWWPDAAWSKANLFTGLRVPWIDLVPATELAGRPHPVYDEGFEYPRRAHRRELGSTILETVREFRRTSAVVFHLLAEPRGHRNETDRGFGLSSAIAWRNDRATGRRIASAYLAEDKNMIRGVDLETPSFVTMSSDSGRFPLSVTNRLDQPVTIELRVRARDPQMSVAPIDPITLQRDQRVTVSVVTNSRGVGITTMTARMQTQTGRAFGRLATFQVRTTQIGAVVWVIMAIGGAVLFVAAGRRIFVRVRAHRRAVRRAR